MKSEEDNEEGRVLNWCRCYLSLENREGNTGLIMVIDLK